MVAMLTWAFIRYSGQYRNVGSAIDQAAEVLLDQVCKGGKSFKFLILMVVLKSLSIKKSIDLLYINLIFV